MIVTKIRFQFEIIVRFCQKHYLPVILGLGIGVLTALLFPGFRTWYSQSSFHPTRIGQVGQFPPERLPTDIKKLISIGLTEADTNGKIEPSQLVKSFEVSEDGLVYTFILNNHILWHDGSTLTTQDINYEIKNIRLEIVSDSQINFLLQEPFSPLPALLIEPMLKKGMIGLGRYKVKKVSVSKGVVQHLVLSPQRPGDPYLAYTFYPNEEELVTAFRLGEIDKIDAIKNPAKLTNDINTITKPNIDRDKNYIALFFNTRIAPFSDKRFRQALAYATNKSEQDRCLGPLSPENWACNNDVKPYAYDPVRAQELFSDSQEQIDGPITIQAMAPELLSLAESIADSWKTVLTLDVNVTLSDDTIDKDNFQVLLAYGSIPTDPDQYLFWHSTQQETNITGITNPRLDELLEEGRQTIDQVKRKEVYQDFQRFLLEESPVIFLSYPTTYTIIRKNTL